MKTKSALAKSVEKYQKIIKKVREESAKIREEKKTTPSGE